VGARSKRDDNGPEARCPLTTVLRWERDQNNGAADAFAWVFLPQCSGGSEIKTTPGRRAANSSAYHSAPVGARSKLLSSNATDCSHLTTVLRWERDQNHGLGAVRVADNLPQCSGGSEIKTRAGRCRRPARPYHSAPVGARSKLNYLTEPHLLGLTTVLRWERDQNRLSSETTVNTGLPQCSGGSEIKTEGTAQTVQPAPYHSAPVGARSKLVCSERQRDVILTTVLRWERDQNMTNLSTP